MWHFTPTMSEPNDLRVSATYTNALVREFGDLLRDHGGTFDMAALEANAATGQTQLEALFMLIKALNETVGPEWRVKASSAWRNQMHGALDVAARSAETCGAAIDVFARFGRVRAPFVDAQKREVRGGTRLTYTPAVAIEDDIWQALAEFIMLSTTAILRQITDNCLTGVQVAMPDRSFEHRQLLEDALGVPVSFGGNTFTISLTLEACALQLPFCDPFLFNNTIEQLQAEAIQLASHTWIVEDVKRLLARQAGVRPIAKSVADELGLSERSLVRKLSAHDTSFRKLLDAHCKNRALMLIEEGNMSHEEIAGELGYSDRTSYSRARRRWFGKP